MVIETTIIIPHYQRAKLLIDTIESIKLQNYNKWECIIVDDGSDEANVKAIIGYISGDSRFTFVSRPDEEIKGANSCRRYGLTLAKGDFIKWFDSDDIMEQDFLSTQVKFIKDGFDGILCNCKVYNDNLTVLKSESWRELNYSNNILGDYLSEKLAWQTGSGLWRKSIFKSYEPFSYDLNNAQEWLFHFDILTLGIKVGVIDKALYKIRSHKSSISYNRNLKYNYHRLLSRLIALEKFSEADISGKKFLTLPIVKDLKRNRGKYLFFGALKTLQTLITYSLRSILIKKKLRQSDFSLIR
ncbi:glycosyltransferase family 2 protein [Pontibacter lucknowensis]|uniref:Glycosyltransferase involved in cell wall bisynthesis n=1 Tax=Pontibacter lucknowensis TaxID=1077936 RepID=A0A1N6Y774_9BACT|nr:glycosyltransferase family 2 protein [Pontibacter lucknowensis]SIR10430.1 Glycosyltransferase involved in cell wall bisynthesis [Pontibacter lucknowensis]